VHEDFPKQFPRAAEVFVPFDFPPWKQGSLLNKQLICTSVCPASFYRNLRVEMGASFVCVKMVKEKKEKPSPAWHIVSVFHAVLRA